MTERVNVEMINAFSDQVKRTDFQRLWIEKLLVFFLKIGENTFLEPIQTEINNYQHINGKEKNIADVASVKYYLQGPVVVKRKVDLSKGFDFSPCLDFTDKAHWLSKYFITQKKTLQVVKETGRYSFDKNLFKVSNYSNDDNEIVISKELIKSAVEIGSIFGHLIHNHEHKQVPAIDSDELVALSCCCEPKDIIGALAAKKIGVKYNNINILDLKFRWGSCTLQKLIG